MNKFYFTFGGFNHELLIDKCVIIEAETELEARNIMFEKFDSNWGFCYTKKPYEAVVEFKDAVYLNKQFTKN